MCSFTLDITVGLGNSSCVLCFWPQVAAWLSICLCVPVSVSFLVCGLLLVVEACLAFVWGRLEVLGSRHSLEQPSFLIPWWDNSELWSSGPLLSPRRMEPHNDNSLINDPLLAFLPCLTSLLPDYTSWNIFPNTVLAPKSLSLDTRTSKAFKHTWPGSFFGSL